MAKRTIYCVHRRVCEEPRIAFESKDDALCIAAAMSIIKDNECVEDCVTELDLIDQLQEVDHFISHVKAMQ